jgi:hypothetical protein
MNDFPQKSLRAKNHPTQIAGIILTTRQLAATLQESCSTLSSSGVKENIMA